MLAASAPAAVAVMWNCLVWSNDARSGRTATPNHVEAHSLGARSGRERDAGPSSEMAGLAESHAHVAATSVATASPVLQTFAPFKNRLGPVVGVFESRPTTPHSSGVTLNDGSAATATVGVDTERRASADVTANIFTARDRALMQYLFSPVKGQHHDTRRAMGVTVRGTELNSVRKKAI